MLGRVLIVAVILSLTSCAEEEGRAEPTSTTAAPTTAPPTSVSIEDGYYSEVLALIDGTEQLIAETPESSANEGGYLTVAAAYSALTDLLEKVEPPVDLRIRHQAFVAQARLISEEAEMVADIPAISLDRSGLPRTGERMGPGFSLSEHRRELRDLVVELRESDQ